MDQKDFEGAVEVAEHTAATVKDDGLVHLSTGVVLVPQPIPKMYIMDVVKELEKKRPKVPVEYIPELEREEENPMSPTYIEEKDRFEDMLNTAMIDLVILKGSKLHSVPEDVEPVESEGWVEDYSIFGISVPKTGKIRYLRWIRSVAAPTDEDVQKLLRKLAPTLGVTEASVDEALSNFPSDEVRESDTPTEADTSV